MSLQKRSRTEGEKNLHIKYLPPPPKKKNIKNSGIPKTYKKIKKLKKKSKTEGKKNLHIKYPPPPPKKKKFIYI